ncbi:MAG TPA: outer membrane protein transport protein [Chitinophagaceae bacterium]|nr:outer membrane protein transport protein [Chitinophagaceae bacterium]
MKKFTILFCILVFLYFHTSAQGFKIDLMGEKQAAMGHTGSGYVFDASTIYFNPGGLSFLKSSNVTAGASVLIPSTEFVENGTNTAYYTQPQIFTPFSVYANFRINSRFAAGIGTYTPYGSGLTWPDNWSGRFILHKIQLQTFYIQPTISYKITDHIGIGIGAIYALGNVQLSKDIPVRNQQSNYPRGTLTGSGIGFGYSAGLFVKPNRSFSFGLAYHSSIKLQVNNGNANFTGVPLSLQTEIQNTTFNTSIPLPGDLSLGVGFKINPRWLVTIDADEVFWQVYDTLAFEYKNQTTLLQNTRTPKNYMNSPGFRAGLQFSPDSIIDIRAGAFFENTPVQKGYLAPDFPDNNRFGLTAGIGIHATRKLDIDISFLFLDVLNRKDSDNADNFSGTYKSLIFAPGAGISYSF